MPAPKDPIKRAQWIANNSTAQKKYHKEHPNANSIAQKKYHKEHPNAAKERNNTPQAKQNQRDAALKYHKEHPNAQKERQNTPQAKANKSAATLARYHSPEVLERIQQYDYPLIHILYNKYCGLDGRCKNDLNNPDYKYYAGRGIQNRFTSFEHFLNYVINELHITTFEQIKGLEIHRTNNDSHYMPGNIEFLTPQQHRTKHKRRK